MNSEWGVRGWLEASHSVDFLLGMTCCADVGGNPWVRGQGAACKDGRHVCNLIPNKE